MQAGELVAKGVAVALLDSAPGGIRNQVLYALYICLNYLKCIQLIEVKSGF